jgi:hypothetical protein
MKIQARDIFTGEQVELTGHITTDHPASSYGLPVLVIEEWDYEAMDLFNWTLSDCKVIDLTVEEAEDFRAWASQFPIV